MKKQHVHLPRVVSFPRLESLVTVSGPLLKRLKVNENIRPMSEFRTGIASFLKQVRTTKRPLIITQHGKGVAVLLDAGEYEAMQERIELLQDVHASIGQIEGGKGIEHDGAMERVLRRIGK